MILDPEYQSLPVHPLSPPYGGAGIRPPKTGGRSYEAVEIVPAARSDLYLSYETPHGWALHKLVLQHPDPHKI